MKEFDPAKLEQKWRNYWEEHEVNKVSHDTSSPKYYILDMFPYPSGEGLHVGHPLGYIATDILARFKKMQGYNVLHPMGFDSFGLPAEQYAIQTGIHPAVSTEKNIQRYRQQLDNLGLNYDWTREVRTSDPKYYKWTQWIFIQLFNHYYNTSTNRAEPIEDLINFFSQSGNGAVKAQTSQEANFTSAEWNNYSQKIKDDILMNYRLAYRKISYVNWCETLGTILANDEVKDGVSERGGYPVEKKPMLQWSLRITAYAERLLNDLDYVEWSDALKLMQRNWIGKSEGAQLFFPIADQEQQLEIFTTRPDTIYGATFMVIAPEHDLVPLLTTPAQKSAIERYQNYVKSRSEVERMAEVKEVTGEFTGSYALNPFTEKRIPIFIAEYVLKDYGTGAIMAVPSDDERDMRFAKKFGLPIIDVVDKTKYPGATLQDKLGIIINSGFLNGMEVPDAIQVAIRDIENRGLGTRKVNYKLRDANYGRQRYWGEPFPIVYDRDGVAHPLPFEELPLELPPLDDFKPGGGGRSPLARHVSWSNLDHGNTRETDTMPGFAGSSWYFLRYMDPQNSDEFASQKAIQYWREVDVYVGGTEHAVGHLMYSRFWHKFLFDKGLVPTMEPFKKLINQGMIQGVIEYLYLQKEKINNQSVFICASLANDLSGLTKIPVHVSFVKDYGQSSTSHLDEEGIKKFVEWRPEFEDAIFICPSGQWQAGLLNKTSDQAFKLITHSEVGKMSKRYYNVVNPDDVVAEYGADCFRMYEMFLGPIQQPKPWDTNGIDGVYKFLKKFWSLFYNDQGIWQVSQAEPTEDELKILHQTIKKVSTDIEKFAFNTCVSTFMVCVNELRRLNCNKFKILEPLTRMLAPFAPHVTEELWQTMYKVQDGSSIHQAILPLYDDKYLLESEIIYPICINGKKRGEIILPVGMDRRAIIDLSREHETVKKWTDGQPIKNVIVVPGKMINVVV